MDANRLAILVLVCASSRLALGANYETTNFLVSAPTPEIARKVGEAAEFWRVELAQQWLGTTLPDWYQRCPISVKVGQIGAGGATTFSFENGEVFGWRMQVQGSLERILDSVIPHEVNHTIFASYFRRPLPRWADEGAATLVEHDSERARQTRLLDQVIRTSRRIPLHDLLTIREYPKDMKDVLTLYAEGYSLADFLVQQKGNAGRATYLKFLQMAHETTWEAAIRKYYRYESVAALEADWTQWILAGSPQLVAPAGTQLAQADRQTTPPVDAANSNAAPSLDDVVIRSQSPSALPPLPRIARALRDRFAREPEPAAANAAELQPENGESLPPLPRDRRLRETSAIGNPGSDLAAPFPATIPRTTEPFAHTLGDRQDDPDWFQFPGRRERAFRMSDTAKLGWASP